MRSEDGIDVNIDEENIRSKAFPMEFELIKVHVTAEVIGIYFIICFIVCLV